MSNEVIIVESPNKIKKIQSFVGNEYNVTASMGHIRNINPKELAIDINNNFKPDYIITDDKKKVVSQLKKLVDSNTIVWLATDYDREGEAISWHLSEVLKIKPENRKRIVFTEITKKAILNSMKKPGDIDMNKFYAQQARMVLDKLIGYKISPILWKKYMNFKLSAGRVQSVVVKIIDEREKEIEQFEAATYFKLIAGFNLKKTTSQEILEKLKLDEKANKKISEHMDNIENYVELNTECDSKIMYVEQINSLNKMLKKKTVEFKISSLKKNTTKRKPQSPYITSTLQQDASNKLGMSPQTCMSCAQKLYEAGLITYMRTDSLVLSDDSLQDIKKYIIKNYGEKYHKYTKYSSKSKNAQEAHEACRPTNISMVDVFGKDGITSQQNRLYKMIWKRTVASQMTPADVEIKTIKISPDFEDDNFIIDVDKFNQKYEKIHLKKHKVEEIEDSDDENDDNDNSDSDNDNSDDNSTTKKRDEHVSKSKPIKYKKLSKENIMKDIKNLNFVGKHEKILFDGFLKVMGNFKGADVVNNKSNKGDGDRGVSSALSNINDDDENNDDDDTTNKESKLEKSEKINKLFSKIKEGDKVRCFYLNSEEKYTKPPHGRYTEASLIKRLDELEIGRPSTYASMVNKVQERNYVEKKTTKPERKEIKSFTYLYMNGISEDTKHINVGGDKNKLFPTLLGRMINTFLVDKFNNLLDYGFTAKIESLLDDVEKGKKIWYKVVQTFYDTVSPIIENLMLNSTICEDKEKLLGNTDTHVYKVINGRFGPVITRINQTSKEITYAPLCTQPENMNLEKAMKCFLFPLELGKYRGKTVVLCRSRNYFIKYDDKSYSIDNYNNLIAIDNKEAEPIIINDLLNNKDYTKDNITSTDFISLEHAINVIDHYDKNSKDIVINKDMVIKYGKYGPYVKYKDEINASVPYKYRGKLDTLTPAICKELVDKKRIKNEKKNLTTEEKTKLRKEERKENDKKRKEEKRKEKLGKIKGAVKPKKEKKTDTIDDQIIKKKEEAKMTSDDPIINAIVEKPKVKKVRKKQT